MIDASQLMYTPILRGVDGLRVHGNAVSGGLLRGLQGEEGERGRAGNDGIDGLPV